MYITTTETWEVEVTYYIPDDDDMSLDEALQAIQEGGLDIQSYEPGDFRVSSVIDIDPPNTQISLPLPLTL